MESALNSTRNVTPTRLFARGTHTLLDDGSRPGVHLKHDREIAMYILILLLIVNGFTQDAQTIGRTPTSSAADLAKCEEAGKAAVAGLGAPPKGVHAEYRCVRVDAPPAATSDE